MYGKVHQARVPSLTYSGFETAMASRFRIPAEKQQAVFGAKAMDGPVDAKHLGLVDWLFWRTIVLPRLEKRPFLRPSVVTDATEPYDGEGLAATSAKLEFSYVDARFTRTLHSFFAARFGWISLRLRLCVITDATESHFGERFLAHGHSVVRIS